MLVPLGWCVVCMQYVPGVTASRRIRLCKVALGYHYNPGFPGWICIGSGSTMRAAGM